LLGQAQEIREFGANLDPMYKYIDRIIPHHPRVSGRITLNNASVMAISVPMIYKLVATMAPFWRISPQEFHFPVGLCDYA
jgi:hypothetical protein